MTVTQTCDCCDEIMNGEGTRYIEARYFGKEYCRACALDILKLIDYFVENRKRGIDIVKTLDAVKV